MGNLTWSGHSVPPPTTGNTWSHPNSPLPGDTTAPNTTPTGTTTTPPNYAGPPVYAPTTGGSTAVFGKGSNYMSPWGTGGTGGDPWDNTAGNPFYSTARAAAGAGITLPTSSTSSTSSNLGQPVADPHTAPPTAGPLSGPGDAENFYKAHGNDLLNTPSASESLYAEGDAGSNPYYDYAQKQTTDSINAAERARGGFNSGAALSEIGNSTANLRGQQAHELGALAGQADSAKLGRYGLSGQMAQTSQDEAQGRILGGIAAETGLDTAQANAVHPFYDSAGKYGSADEQAAIAAELAGSGVDAKKLQAWLGIAGSIGGGVTKAIAAA